MAAGPPPAESAAPVEGREDGASRRLYGRVVAVFFLVSGTLAFIPAISLQGSDRAGTIAVGTAAIAFGIAVWLAPWQRWPRQALLWLVILPGFTLISLSNLYGGSDYHN